MIKQNFDNIDKNTDFALSNGELKLIAVSKYASNEQIEEAYGLGIRDFGENYIVPALKRRPDLEHLKDINWHLLGPIQKNKINKVVGNFSLIHSVHTEETAHLIDQKAQALNITQDILLQINLTDDKAGFEPEGFEEKFLKLLELKHINIKGLMLMNYHEISKKSETNFEYMRHLKEMMRLHCPGRVFELSMGMSNDYHLAIKHGANIIRIGKALFG